MAARSVGSGTISFGLVSIPVRLYVATHSEQLSFNMLHQPCGGRIKQNIFCPTCDRTIERRDTVKGYQFQKDQYVTLTEDELKALEAEANRSIDIHEFVPLASVDPIYFEHAHYLGPDKGAEKAYRLLGDSMRDTGKVALAQMVHHGKEHLVLVRAHVDGLVLHSMYYADEVRSFAEVEKGGEQKMRPAEIDLARKLIEQLSSDEFRPEQYHDQYRERLNELVQKKVEGHEITAAAEPATGRAEVIDLMDALKASLARQSTKSAARSAGESAGKRRPAAATRHEATAPKRRATSKK
jgi:DNA end-binding protein Ku